MIRPCYKSISIMKRNSLWVLAIFLLMLSAGSVQAQKGKSKTQKPTKSQPQKTTPKQKQPTTNKPQAPKATDARLSPEAKEHEAKVRDMVAFLEYVLNTLGSKQTSARDKDVLVTQSYTKIFRDPKVQVEDDLDEGRKTITNKDVQAYLKDVDFFFDDATFKLDIEDLRGEVSAGNTLFYTVTVRRKLQGTTSEGQRVNSNLKRFIEINYLPEDQDLKIVSMYTHESIQKDAEINWWKQLSYEWQSVFRRRFNITTDSVSVSNIKDIMALDALDLSRNTYVQSLDPLAGLVNLRTLNLSHTAITDITPLRNLSELTELDLSYTKVQDISALKYCDKLARFKITATPVQDITVIQELPALEHLEMGKTNVSDFSALTMLISLKHIDVHATRIASLDPLKGLTQLTELNASQTAIGNLNPVSGLTQLEVLSADSTAVADVNALSALGNLAGGFGELHAGGRPGAAGKTGEAGTDLCRPQSYYTIGRRGLYGEAPGCAGNNGFRRSERVVGRTGAGVEERSAPRIEGQCSTHQGRAGRAYHVGLRQYSQSPRRARSGAAAHAA